MTRGVVFVLGIFGKAIILGATATLLNIGFIRAVVLVLISATVTGGWTLLVTFVQVRENRKLHQANEEMAARLAAIESRQVDVAGAVGVGKRRTDPLSTHPATDEAQ